MNIPDITVEQLEHWFQDNSKFALLDIREPYEHKIVQFERTTHQITMGNLARDIHTLPEETPIVIYCRSGVRSIYATKLFLEEGFDMALNLKGGILEYIRFHKKDWPTY